jgi:hypothetical protein
LACGSGLGGFAVERIRAGMSLDQKRARVFGVLFLITFITSIPALALYQPVLDDPVGYIAGAGQTRRSCLQPCWSCC